MMKLTIIYHLYEKTNTLEKSLNSLFNQSNKNFELILIDDCGSNETKTVLDNFDISGKNVSLIRLFENYGRSFCYNLGIERAKGEYIYCAESKNIFDKSFVDTVLKIIDEKKGYDYLSFLIESYDGKNKVFNEDTEINEKEFMPWIVNSSLTIRNKIIRKKFLEENKINFVNYKNLYPIYLYEIISNSKKAFFVNKELVKIEHKNNRLETYSYNLYDILESAFLLSFKINDSNLDDNLKDHFEVWLSKLCLHDFLKKMFDSYDNEKVLAIAIRKAWETLEKIDASFKYNKCLNLLSNQKVKDYIKNFKPTLNYVKKNLNSI